MSVSLNKLAAHAPPEAVALARTILEQAVADQDWSDQIGPALSQRDVARLLMKSPQAVTQDPRLLRLRQRDGRPVYPVFQFDGRRQVPGVAEVLATLGEALEPLTIAAWLTASNRRLEGKRPVDLLRKGHRALVMAAAARYRAAAR